MTLMCQMLNSAARDENSLEKTMSKTIFVGVLKQKSVHSVIPHFWEGRKEEKFWCFFFPLQGRHMKMPEIQRNYFDQAFMFLLI